MVTYHTGPRLKECIYGLLADPDISETVIVNNGNPDDVRDWLETLEAKKPDVRVLTGHGNIGFGAGVNRGVDRAAGPHILVLNPDAVLRWNSIQGMQSIAKTCPTPWIIGGKIFDLFGREERGGRRKKLTLWRAVTNMLGWNTWTLEDTPPPSEPLDMPVISGAFFLSSKDSLAALNGFDEGYFLHVEDVDLCRRCWESGGRVKYDPRAGALHYGSTSDAPNRAVQNHKADSLERYFKTFASGPVQNLIVRLSMPFMRLGMALTRR